MPSPAVAQILRQPATGLRQLTIGAGVITPQMRASGVLPLDDTVAGLGLAVYPASNAAVLDATLNGNFETNTTGWTNNAAGGVISRITTDAKFGSACLQTVNDGTGANQGPITSAETGLTAGNVYTLGFWAKSVSGATTVRISIDWLTVLDAAISSSTSDITLTTAWQKFILTATAAVLGVHAKIKVINLAATAATYNIDGVQFDNGSVALPFDPANTRIAGRVRLSLTGLLTATTGGFAACLKMGYPSTGLPALNAGIFEWYLDANNRINLEQSASTGHWQCVRGGTATFSNANVAATAFSVGGTALVVGEWSATQSKISENGVAFTTANGSVIPALVALGDVGSEPNTAGAVASNLLWGLFYKGQMAAADLTLMNTLRLAGGVPTLAQIAMLSPASKPTCLVPGKTQDVILLPAYYEGAH